MHGEELSVRVCPLRVSVRARNASQWTRGLAPHNVQGWPGRLSMLASDASDASHVTAPACHHRLSHHSARVVCDSKRRMHASIQYTPTLPPWSYAPRPCTRNAALALAQLASLVPARTTNTLLGGRRRCATGHVVSHNRGTAASSTVLQGDDLPDG